MHRQTLGAVMLLLASPCAVTAQTSRSDPVDVQARMGLQLKLALPWKWDASVGYEVRKIGDASQYHGSYTDGELGRALGKRLRMFTNYRFAKVANDDSHRFGGGAEAETKNDHFSVSLRPQFQYQFSALEEADQAATRTVRARLRVKVPAGKRLAVYGSAEPFFALGGDNYYPIDNWRNAVGVQWEFLKKSKIDAYYIYRPDYAKIYNRTYHIVGLEISREMKIRN